jgi:hypothetical protein
VPVEAARLAQAVRGGPGEWLLRAERRGVLLALRADEMPRVAEEFGQIVGADGEGSGLGRGGEGGQVVPPGWLVGEEVEHRAVVPNAVLPATAQGRSP